MWQGWLEAPSRQLLPLLLPLPLPLLPLLPLLLLLLLLLLLPLLVLLVLLLEVVEGQLFAVVWLTEPQWCVICVVV